MTAVRRVGQVSAAIEGSPALIGGYAAHFLVYVLDEELQGGLEGVMARRGMSGAARLHLRHAVAALEAAAAAFEDLPRGTSSSRNGEATDGDLKRTSEEWITSAHASRLLDRSQRRVQQLAAGGDLTSRLRAGRLELPRAEVLAHGERMRARERSAA